MSFYVLSANGKQMIQDPQKKPDPLQKLINLSLANTHSTLKISLKSVHNLLRYLTHTDTNYDKNISSLAEVTIQTTARHTIIRLHPG